jgi:hypothetical protein
VKKNQVFIVIIASYRAAKTAMRQRSPAMTPGRTVKEDPPAEGVLGATGAAGALVFVPVGAPLVPPLGALDPEEGAFEPPPLGAFEPPPLGAFEPPPLGALEPPSEGAIFPPPFVGVLEVEEGAVEATGGAGA